MVPKPFFFFFAAPPFGGNNYCWPTSLLFNFIYLQYKCLYTDCLHCSFSHWDLFFKTILPNKVSPHPRPSFFLPLSEPLITFYLILKVSVHSASYFSSIMVVRCLKIIESFFVFFLLFFFPPCWKDFANPFPCTGMHTRSHFLVRNVLHWCIAFLIHHFS